MTMCNVGSLQWRPKHLFFSTVKLAIYLIIVYMIIMNEQLFNTSFTKVAIDPKISFEITKTKAPKSKQEKVVQNIAF